MERPFESFVCVYPTPPEYVVSLDTPGAIVFDLVIEASVFTLFLSYSTPTEALFFPILNSFSFLL